jgi:hypothetical protein
MHWEGNCDDDSCAFPSYDSEKYSLFFSPRSDNDPCLSLVLFLWRLCWSFISRGRDVSEGTTCARTVQCGDGCWEIEGSFSRMPRWGTLSMSLYSTRVNECVEGKGFYIAPAVGGKRQRAATTKGSPIPSTRQPDEPIGGVDCSPQRSENKQATWEKNTSMKINPLYCAPIENNIILHWVFSYFIKRTA